MIAILDYGVGNLANVERALRRAGAADVRITRDPGEVLSARAIVLPGVGNFGHCARQLRRYGLHETIAASRDREIPLLGLCVGMQLLFEESEEDPGTPGLGLWRGRVRRLRVTARVPHTGWNQLRLVRSHPWLVDVPDAAFFYFVHSFAAEPSESQRVVAVVDHGGRVTAAVGEGDVLGVQFHPEKSGAMGARLLRSFARAAA